MHRACALQDEYRKETLLTIVVLTELRVLDVSKSAGFVHRLRDAGAHPACAPNVLKHLTTFDLSGNAFGFTMSDIRDFIENHPNLKTIGLAGLNYNEAMGICELSRNYPKVMALLSLVQSCIEDREIISVVNDVINEILCFLDEDVRLEIAGRIVNTIFTCMKHHRNNLRALRNCFALLCGIVFFFTTSEKVLCINLIIRSLQEFTDNKLIKLGLEIIHAVTGMMSEAAQKAITADPEFLEGLLTVIAKRLPRRAVKTLIAFNYDCLLVYILGANSNPNFDFDYCRRLRWMIDILPTLIQKNSDACPKSAELADVMIVVRIIQVCSEVSIYAPILNECHDLKLIILYVASLSQEKLRNSRWPLEISPQDLPITTDEFGVLHCGSVVVPKSFSSFYKTPSLNSNNNFDMACVNT
ncbi:hypothetical protein Aperf_G00000100572 [Anoplocephala perfoliata]